MAGGGEGYLLMYYWCSELGIGVGGAVLNRKKPRSSFTSARLLHMGSRFPLPSLIPHSSIFRFYGKSSGIYIGLRISGRYRLSLLPRTESRYLLSYDSSFNLPDVAAIAEVVRIRPWSLMVGPQKGRLKVKS